MKRTAFLALVLAGITTTHSLLADGLSLSEAWKAAVAHDPGMAAANASADAGAARRAQSRALWMPTVTASGGAAFAHVDQQTLGATFATPQLGVQGDVAFRSDVSHGTATRWAITAQQPLWDAGRSAQAASGRAAAGITQAQELETRQELMLRCVQSYFDVIDARQRLEAVQHLHAAALQALAASKARYDAGDIAVTDAREAAANADGIAVQELDARTNLSLSEASFTELTGESSAGIGSLRSTPDEPGAATEPLQAWIDRAVVHNSAILVRQQSVAAAAAQVTQFEALGRPQIDLVAQVSAQSVVGNNSAAGSDIYGRDARIGVQATLPLFTGGMNGARRREAEALRRQAEAELAATTESVRTQVRSAWWQLNTAGKRVEALAKARGSAASRRDATKLGTEVGGRTTLDLLNAEAELQRADTAFEEARREAIVARLQLKAVAGELTESDLIPVDARLEYPQASVTKP